jgi:hypothetical protein
LDLGGDQIHAHPVQIHFLGLQRPFRAVAHPPESPEKQNEKVNHRDSAKRDQAFLAERFTQIAEPRWRHVHHLFAAAPEEQSGDNHGDTGNSKGPARPPFRICQQPRTKKRRNERAGINREIKPAKHFREQMFVRFAELIAHVR